MIHVVKIGGYLINEPEGLQAFLDSFCASGTKKILIHGGGRLSTELATKLDIPVRMIEGRRITDYETLRIAVMSYAGWANKEIVAGLQARNVNALGLSGADGDMIRAVKRAAFPIDYGYVGDISSVNHGLLRSLLDQYITPVICAISHDGQGNLLNTNADTIAARVAMSLLNHDDVSLHYCFEHDGVLKDINDPESPIAELSFDQFTEMKEKKEIHSGMIPKLSNGFDALNGGCTVHICGVEQLWTLNKSTRLCQ